MNFDLTAYSDIVENVIEMIEKFYESVNFTIAGTSYNLLDIMLSWIFITLVIAPLFDNDDENPF